ncbi:MAG: hypothetical protein BHV77_11640 [Bacteroides sp. 43_108]|nr:MAG: hypothetical protein BHV77_11640 [Bacteroides sp. 43_108]
MRRKNTEQIGDIIMQFLRSEGLETPLNQYRLIEAWKDVLGQDIGKYTGEMFIKNQTLHVQIKSSVLKQDLMMSRSNIIKRLNEYVKANVITEIIFH